MDSKPVLIDGSSLREGFLGLHQQLNEILADDWSGLVIDEIKRRISAALAHSLKISI